MQKLSSRIIILIVIKGVIQQLHFFAPTPPLCGQLLYRELEHKMPLLTPPPSSRPHSYWMAPNILDPQDRKSHYPPDLSVHCHVSLSSCGSTSAARAAAAAAPPPSCAAYSYAVMTKALWVSRVLKYPKKCLEDLTMFFMSTWWGDSKNMEDIEFSRWPF